MIRIPGFSFLRLTIIAFIMILVISYISMHKLVFVSKNLSVNGKKMVLMAKEIREKLIKEVNAQKFSCKTKDNITIHGLTIERENPIATLILCHGFRCCKELTARYVDTFKNYNAVLFDFRSHGENRRSITTIGCHEYKDVLAVSNWIKNNKPNLAKVPIVVLGISMGGASALKALEKDPTLCDALIVDSSFSNLNSVLYNVFSSKSGLPTFPFLPIMKKMFNYVGSCNIDAMKPLNSVKKIKKPLMLIHSCIDNFIPVQESLLMYAQATEVGAKLWIGPECKHGRLHEKYPELYKKKVESFLTKRVL